VMHGHKVCSGHPRVNPGFRVIRVDPNGLTQGQGRFQVDWTEAGVCTLTFCGQGHFRFMSG